MNKVTSGKPTPNMNDLAGKLWTALEAAQSLLTHEDPSVRLKAISAMGTVGSAYSKIHTDAQRERWNAKNPFLTDGPLDSLRD